MRYTLHAHQDIQFLPAKNRLIIDDVDIHLEPLQSKLLFLLVEHPNQVLTLEQIVESVWQRSQVSHNLVRQVVSALRAHLGDDMRPYNIIETVPKQGYLLSVEVTLEQTNNQSISKPKRLHWSWLMGSTIAATALVASVIFALHSAPSKRINEATKLVIHPFTLENEQDNDLSDSIENYLYYGLNSKGIDVYRHKLDGSAEQLKGSLTEERNHYKLTLFLDQGDNAPIQIEKTFTLEDYFTAIGDVATELKTQINHDDWQYEPNSHQITSVDNLNDWQIISQGIEHLYSGSDELNFLNRPLNAMQQQGRDNYLVDALLSYSRSVDYLKAPTQKKKDDALLYARQAFKQDPRCDISNLSLGLALMINQEYDQAYPYLSYAVETSPSALGYYLLYKVDQKTHNDRGAKYYLHRFQCMAQKPLDGVFTLSALK